MNNNTNMNNNNNKNQKQRSKAAKLAQKQLKAQVLNELRSAAGMPAKGRGRGKRNRQAKANSGAQGQAGAAAAYATGQVGRAPAITMTRDMCRIVHRELIGSVVGTAAFTVANSFALNPGLAATFPWLSIMAQGWEQYRFRKLKFCYYTRTGSNIPGSVILAPDYDAADAAPASEQIASAFEDVAEDAPWKDIECVCAQLSMAAGTTRHFTRSGALAANLDVKTYDVGNLHLCTVDGTAVNWGKLWVEYDIEFFVPQLPPTGQLALVGGQVTGATTQTGANPFGVAPTLDTQSAGITMSAASVLTFGSAGTFLCGVRYIGTGITVVGNPTASAGATIVSGGSDIVAAATSATQEIGVNVTVPGSTLTYGITATTVTSAILHVASAPSGAFN